MTDRATPGPGRWERTFELGMRGAAAIRPWAVVATEAGAVVGSRHRGVLQFWGVPYADPPVGAHRFAPPPPLTPWVGVRDATWPRSLPPQQTPSHCPPGGVRRGREREACCTVAIATPGCRGRRPVMVWFHPGAFVDGGGSLLSHDPGRLARQADVVVVAIDHRLGALGWLHPEHLPGAEGATTNAGLLDQVAALRWVRDNIAAFGGDPGAVTVVGASAGALSIAALMSSPRSEGLFHRAILQSGPLGQTVRPDRAATYAERLLAACGVAHLDALRRLDVPRILAAQRQLAMEDAVVHGPRRPHLGQFGFGPVVDGRILPAAPLDAAAAGATAPIPLVVGTNRDEWQVFAVMSGESVEAAAVAELLTPAVGERTDAVLAAYRAEVGDDPRDLVTAVMTDLLFAEPSDRFAVLHAGAHRARVGTWAYRFEWQASAAIGACHGVEQPFVFGRLLPWQLATASPLVGPWPPRSLRHAIGGAWSSFAHAGDPRHDGVPGWRPLGEADEVAVFDVPVRLEPRTSARHLRAHLAG